jgi:hypothetical protein
MLVIFAPFLLLCNVARSLTASTSMHPDGITAIITAFAEIPARFAAI